IVINLLNYIDRLAVNGLLEPIRKEFGASDADMGLVGLAFLLTYASLPPLFGWLGDRMSRTRVIAGSAAFWSIATALTGRTRGAGATTSQLAAAHRQRRMRCGRRRVRSPRISSATASSSC